MDLSEYINQHIRWKSTTEWILFNDADQSMIDQLAQSNGCKLGEWLASLPDGEVGSSGPYRELITAHDAFHQKLIDIMIAWNQGRVSEAKQNHFEFELLSDQIVRLLREIEDRCSLAVLKTE
jgi:hypothetical protein